ncbi:aminopeptidase N-like [Penaeus japonicus]|uniref:aminopeptidase N-like n=1 Tax=Penaeus japonicus TaxID=27405 RepID=UPI001C71532E|nr:aminopeptidase N-like [Penaeus japonicus]
MSPTNMFWRPSVASPSFGPVSSVPWQMPMPTSQTPYSLWYQPPRQRQVDQVLTGLPQERRADDLTPMQQPTTEASTSSVQSFRLPLTLKPLHYVVKLQPFVNGNFSIFGHVEVEMEVLETTSNITLHMADIITKNDTVKILSRDEAEAGAVNIRMHQYDPERQFYIAHLEEALQKGKKYVLAMEFVGYLNDQLRGFYRTTYVDGDGIQKNLAATNFEPSFARHAFPCFDEPALKATFEIFLARENWMTSVANMPDNETLPLEGQNGWEWDHYQETIPIPTFQVGFLVSSFAHVNSTENDHVNFRVWARRAILQQVDYAREVGPRILASLEDYLNITFPPPKQDLIAVPEATPRGTNSWGIVHVSESQLLFLPETSSVEDQEQVAHAVAHALAQQCLADLVTPGWWDDVCLNRGLAAFVEYMSVDLLEPDWKTFEGFVVAQLQSAFELDCLEASHEMVVPVTNPEEVNEFSDVIAYGKGSSVFRMMSHFLGDQLFRDGLSNYLNEINNVSSNHGDLWESLTIAAHQSSVLPQNITVQMVMDTWTLQKGFPVIQVVRSSNGTSATISQERFRFAKNSAEIPDHKWWVPLTYTSQSEADFNRTQAALWMKASEDHLTVSSLPPKDQWVIFNLQETGYYRVNYDDHNWKLLIRQLRDDHEAIHVVNRAQIIDDAMNLARAGQLRYETALHVLSYLKNETEYLPWSAALNNLEYIDAMLDASRDRIVIKGFLLDLVMPLYDSLRVINDTDDQRPMQHLQEIAMSWACKLGSPQCLGNALTSFQMWMNAPNNRTIISPSLKATVYCHAIAEGGESEWAFAWNQYVTSSVESEKSKLLYGLGCSKQIPVLSRYLETAFLPNGEIRRQDSAKVFASIAKNRFGRSLAWNFIRERWNYIFTFDKRQRSKMLKEITYFFNTREDLEQLQLFLHDKTKVMTDNLRGTAQAVERTSNNLFWVASNYNTIVNLLKADQVNLAMRGRSTL